jgi:hypothetical protein
LRLEDIDDPKNLHGGQGIKSPKSQPRKQICFSSRKIYKVTLKEKLIETLP